MLTIHPGSSRLQVDAPADALAAVAAVDIVVAAADAVAIVVAIATVVAPPSNYFAAPAVELFRRACPSLLPSLRPPPLS